MSTARGSNVDTDRAKAKPRRHCMVVMAFYPAGESRVRREAEALVKSGWEVDVICLRWPTHAVREVCHGVNVYRLPIRLWKDGMKNILLNYIAFTAMASAQLIRLHAERHYDVIQAHNLPDFLVFSAGAAKLQGTRVILDLHDLMPEFFAGRYNGDEPEWLARVVRLQEKASCRFADHVITVSDHWRDALIRRGVPADKTSVVMNLADDQIFNKQGKYPRQERNGEFKLMYHGTIVHRYGLDLAIKAVAKVRDHVPGIRLDITGGGDGLPELEELIRELGAGDYVELHYRLRQVEELPEMIRQSDLGIVPYRNDVFTDSLLPTKLLEYVAMGMPSIASRTTAIERYFGSSVELFEPGSVDDLANRILKLYRSPEQMSRLSSACREFNDKYNWTDVSREYVNLVEDLAASRRR